ncbi:MAG TPA: sugar phosphate isomerase/epimerase [Terriglobales bacterium]|nr:sugar phosphate isomerase/epimerase [Terriglobales bacterium]
MKTCFSTLACPNWTLPQVVEIAMRCGYEGLELRFLEGEDSLWKLAAFQGSGLTATKSLLRDSGLTVACVGTSCRFHFPSTGERQQWINEGTRMAELAAQLGSSGIRVFGDKIQQGASRNETRGWIAEGIRNLADGVGSWGVGVWLESHGDFASSAETLRILRDTRSPHVGVVWDPANAFTDGGEDPVPAAKNFGDALRHVHFRDLNCENGAWQPVLTGEGKFPLREILAELRKLSYSGFCSFEWEKKWRPELAGPEIAIPQFADWFRQHGSDKNDC